MHIAHICNFQVLHRGLRTAQDLLLYSTYINYAVHEGSQFDIRSMIKNIIVNQNTSYIVKFPRLENHKKDAELLDTQIQGPDSRD